MEIQRAGGCGVDAFAGVLDRARQGSPGAGGPGGAQPYPTGAYAGQPYGCPDNCIGDYWYGFISQAGMVGVETNGTILAGAIAVITSQPQKPNQPRRLYCNQTIDDNFIMVDFKIGVEPVLVTAGPIPFTPWVLNAHTPDFRRIICPVGIVCALTVQNISTNPATFRAGLSAFMLA